MRKAYSGQADADNVITSFTSDITIPTPRLRHVVFSSDEDFLVLTAESGGGLAVYNTESVLNKKNPENQIGTDQISVRALVPNPNPQFGQYFAVILENGRLFVVDISDGKQVKLQEENATCVAWSNRGKAVIAGQKDGSAVQYGMKGDVMATVPRPPDMDASYIGELH